VSRLKTLVRVAELQEAVARGQAGRALVAARAAELGYRQQLAHLRSGGVAGGTREALSTSSAVQLWRAEAVAGAQAEAVEAARLQQEAIAGWITSRRRHRLIEGLAERQLDQERAERDRKDQLLADELAASRQGSR
jgi:flagellar biosynthesis chaperone FliJ